jgi:Protein of unknown function (DUF2938)
MARGGYCLKKELATMRIHAHHQSRNVAPSLRRAALAGLLATIVMDVAGRMLVARVLGITPAGPAKVNNLGRWFGHMREGKFAHDDIESAAPIPREAAIGVGVHYAIGSTLGVVFGLLLAASRRESSPLLGIVYGAATTAFAWFVVHPACGYGAMGLRGGDPRVPAFTLANHTIFGLGLWLATSTRRGN